jgi:hypothetical protein
MCDVRIALGILMYRDSKTNNAPRITGCPNHVHHVVLREEHNVPNSINRVVNLRPMQLMTVSTYDHKNYFFFVITFYLQSVPVK